MDHLRPVPLGQLYRGRSCLRGHDPLGNQERHGLSIGPGPHPTTRVFCVPTRGYRPDLRMHGYTIFAYWQAKPKPTGGPSHLARGPDRKSTRLNSSHVSISYAVFCLKKKTNTSQKST